MPDQSVFARLVSQSLEALESKTPATIEKQLRRRLAKYNLTLKSHLRQAVIYPQGEMKRFRRGGKDYWAIACLIGIVDPTSKQFVGTRSNLRAVSITTFPNNEEVVASAVARFISDQRKGRLG